MQLTIAISFVFSEGIDEKHEMHLKSGNIEIKIYDKQIK